MFKCDETIILKGINGKEIWKICFQKDLEIDDGTRYCVNPEKDVCL